MKKFLIVISLLLMTFPLYANIQNDLEVAIGNYKAEKYNDTIKIYENIISDGFVNPIVYYNLAASYLKINNIGKASLNVERALIFTPRDKDARKLKIYVSKLIKEPQQNFAERKIEYLKHILNLNEITFLMLISFAMGSVFVVLYFILYKKVWLNVSILFFVLFFISFPIFYLKITDEVLTKQAIVIKDVDVRNKPVYSEEVSFSINAGRKIIVLDEIGRWANIKLDIEGLSGWIDKHSLEII